MDPPPSRRRSLAVSNSSHCSVASPATLSGDPADHHVRPSAEEWYPRLYLGWNHKLCVDVYCYFTARPFHADLEIKWAIHPLGPPFHGKRQTMSFDHILQLVDTQSNSDAVRAAIALGLSTKYHAQGKFKDDTPVYNLIEPTSEEILIAWEDHSLDISEDDNTQRVKEAVMSTFGFNIRTDDVELLIHFSRLNDVSIFETNTWRQMMCFKCCPKKNASRSPAALMSRTANLRKRKNDEISESTIEPSSKRVALSGPKEVASNADLKSSTAVCDSQVLVAPGHSEPSQPASLNTDPVAKRGQASDAAEQGQEAPAAVSSTSLVVGTGIDITQAPNSLGETDVPPLPAIAVNSALSTILTISSWLRLLPSATILSGNTCSTVQIWLKDTFEIDAASEDITKMTESARAENISPLQTTVFRCMAIAARKDLGNILMNPRGPTGVDVTRGASLRVVSGNIGAAVRKAFGGVEVTAQTNSTEISNYT
ncbi:hypothetical protein ONS95_001715 [Cadophora gregata]|uniref:uncharacterized protein n=1 Tax=Cadophora gregata TaxID=51156 RepID=UPI0026DBB4CD|nr:uncharacterized protein ONS95_001715 [Cadophora gregata]KAK0111354.1 hypothetical protein ONS95_001715 [Cadophora gregata]